MNKSCITYVITRTIINMSYHLDTASVRDEYHKSVTDDQKVFIMDNDDRVGRFALINIQHSMWSLN